MVPLNSLVVWTSAINSEYSSKNETTLKWHIEQFSSA